MSLGEGSYDYIERDRIGIRVYRLSLNSKFIRIKAIKKAHIKAKDRQIKAEDFNISKDSALHYLV